MSEKKVVRVPILLWAALVSDLMLRGQGRRESGAFVLGRRKGVSYKAQTYLCYDDLDPNSLMGEVDFHAAGYAALWEQCRQRNFEVLFDVHTHPGNNVEQSRTDQTHPMVPEIDHLALILPRFGQTSRWSLREAGIHEYRGNFQWNTVGPNRSQQRIRLCLW